MVSWRVSAILGWSRLWVVLPALVCIGGMCFGLDWGGACVVCGGFFVGWWDFRFGCGGCVGVMAICVDLVRCLAMF